MSYDTWNVGPLEIMSYWHSWNVGPLEIMSHSTHEM